MSKFKKTALTCALATAFLAGPNFTTPSYAAAAPSAVAQAQSTSAVKNSTLFLSGSRSYYPVVKLANTEAAYRIDCQIQRYIGRLCAGIDSGKYSFAAMDYSLRFEDNDLLSLVIKQYVYKDHAANGETRVYGKVYSKKTGKTIPLKNYLNVSAAQLQKAINDGQVIVRGSNGAKALAASNLIAPIKAVPHNYFLQREKDGSVGIGLIFQPGTIAPYSDGIIHVLFSSQEVQKLNALNK